MLFKCVFEAGNVHSMCFSEVAIVRAGYISTLYHTAHIPQVYIQDDVKWIDM